MVNNIGWGFCFKEELFWEWIKQKVKKIIKVKLNDS